MDKQIINEIPENNIREMEPSGYADGDFDIGVWEEEIEDMKAHDMEKSIEIHALKFPSNDPIPEYYDYDPEEEND